MTDEELASAISALDPVVKLKQELLTPDDDPWGFDEAQELLRLQRMQSRRALNKLHTGNRFRLMFGQPMLPNDQVDRSGSGVLFCVGLPDTQGGMCWLAGYASDPTRCYTPSCALTFETWQAAADAIERAKKTHPLKERTYRIMTVAEMETQNDQALPTLELAAEPGSDYEWVGRSFNSDVWEPVWPDADGQLSYGSSLVYVEIKKRNHDALT